MDNHSVNFSLENTSKWPVVLAGEDLIPLEP